MGHINVRENYNNDMRGIYRGDVSLQREMEARRNEARQTQTGDPQHFLSRLALELEDPRTHEVIRKFFLMVEDTRTHIAQ